MSVLCMDQVREMASNHGVESVEELRTMLTFYHDLGLLIHYGAKADGSATQDTVLENTVVLSPQWLAHNFQHVVTGSRPRGQVVAAFCRGSTLSSSLSLCLSVS